MFFEEKLKIYVKVLKNYLRVVVQDVDPGPDLGGRRSRMDCTSSPVGFLMFNIIMYNEH